MSASIVDMANPSAEGHAEEWVTLHRHDGVDREKASTVLTRIDGLTNDVRTPFSDELIETLGMVSRQMLRADFSRAHPQLMALAYWLRPAALKRLKLGFEAGNDAAVPVARGLAYHVPPANVDTLFAYSWALSFLVGNSNVTRVSSELNPVAAWLLAQIEEAIDQHGQSARQVFCTFDKSGNVGAEMSARADLRVIWGGDAKIRTIAASETRPDGLTIGFSDRKSLCLIRTAAYVDASPQEKLDLAEKLFNDIYWFDQMGCGSPRLVLWVGDALTSEETSAASAQLYTDLLTIIDRQQHETDVSVDISKFVFANHCLAAGLSPKARRYSGDLMVLDAAPVAELWQQVHGGGLLFQSAIARLEDIEPLVNRSLQTITTYGFELSDKHRLARHLNGRGGYRIVPVGEALNFDAVWDGIDLLKHFSRVISIR